MQCNAERQHCVCVRQAHAGFPCIYALFFLDSDTNTKKVLLISKHAIVRSCAGVGGFRIGLNPQSSNFVLLGMDENHCSNCFIRERE